MQFIFVRAHTFGKKYFFGHKAIHFFISLFFREEQKALFFQPVSDLLFNSARTSINNRYFPVAHSV
jgi:hypothetical protein